MQRPFVVLACGLQGFLFKGVIIYSIYSLESAVFFLNFTRSKYIMETMRNILYICIMLLGIMCFVGCNDHNGHKILLARTDSLLQNRPVSALKLLNSIEKDV